MDLTEESTRGLRVAVEYGELRAEFSGNPEDVVRSVNAFISKQLPAYDLAKKLALNYSSKELVERFQNYVRITPEGPRILSDVKELTDKELLALQLVANKIAFETGSLSNEYSRLGELQESISLNPKSLSSRLSELARAGHVIRKQSDEGSSFKISTHGISWLESTLS